MINELKRMIVEKLSTQEELDLIHLRDENAFLKKKTQIMEDDLKTALDEISQNQIRIHALLKQLQDKNGGR